MKIEYKGADQYLIMLSQMQGKTKSVAGKAIYAAANIVADAIKANLKALPAVSERHNIIAYKTGGKSKLSEKQKQGLLDGFGIAKMEYKDGYYNVKAGFDGYNDISTDSYPKGQPNPLIARCVENGSSYMDATPFVKPAVNKSRKAAIAEMQRVIDEEYEKMMKG